MYFHFCLRTGRRAADKCEIDFTFACALGDKRLQSGPDIAHSLASRGMPRRFRSHGDNSRCAPPSALPSSALPQRPSIMSLTSWAGSQEPLMFNHAVLRRPASCFGRRIRSRLPRRQLRPLPLCSRGPSCEPIRRLANQFDGPFLVRLIRKEVTHISGFPFGIESRDPDIPSCWHSGTMRRSCCWSIPCPIKLTHYPPTTLLPQTSRNAFNARRCSVMAE